MLPRWRGRPTEYREQVANACDDFVDLTPVSDTAADLVKSHWSALISGQAVPLIGEDRYGFDCQEDDGCPREC
jgi:hypothetical protein